MNVYQAMRSRASYAVQEAQRKGVLPAPQQLDCADCGNQAIEYDHRDYGKPLEVVAVCHRCNVLRGKAKYSGLAHAKRRHAEWRKKIAKQKWHPYNRMIISAERRQQRAAELKATGLSAVAIAKKLGISRQRVYQILARP